MSRVERDQVLIDKIGKLLSKAASTKIEAERDLFTNKAMELIAANNLDMAAIEQGTSGAKAAKRSDEKHAGGLYTFQRNLWYAVADLNFCMYWTLRVWDPDKVSAYKRKLWGANAAKRCLGGYTFQHRLVGRTVNIASTVAMARYLEATIERLLLERLSGDTSQLFTTWSNRFREGVADEVRRKIYARREEQLAEEQRAEQKAREAEADKFRGVHSTGTSITLSSVKESEEAANHDFIYGEGSYARKMARRARAAEEQARADAEYTKWAKENPEEARKREEEQERRWNKANNRRRGSSKPDKYDSGAYWSGREAGEKVSIDQQVESGTKGYLK